MLQKFFAFIRAGIKEAVIGGVSDAIEEIDQRADVPAPRIPVAGNGRRTKVAKAKK